MDVIFLGLCRCRQSWGASMWVSLGTCNEDLDARRFGPRRCTRLLGRRCGLAWSASIDSLRVPRCGSPLERVHVGLDARRSTPLGRVDVRGSWGARRCGLAWSACWSASIDSLGVRRCALSNRRAATGGQERDGCGDRRGGDLDGRGQERDEDRGDERGEGRSDGRGQRDERGDGSGGDHDGRDQEHDEDCGDERGEGRYDGRCDGSGQERDGRGGDRDVATGTWLGDDGRLPRRCATLTPPGCQELWAHAWRAPDCAPARTGAPRTHASIVPSLPCARLMTGQRIFARNQTESIL